MNTIMESKHRPGTVWLGVYFVFLFLFPVCLLGYFIFNAVGPIIKYPDRLFSTLAIYSIILLIQNLNAVITSILLFVESKRAGIFVMIGLIYCFVMAVFFAGKQSATIPHAVNMALYFVFYLKTHQWLRKVEMSEKTPEGEAVSED